MWGGGDDDASVAAIRAAIDEGVTLIDTAPAYGLGRAEEVVGRAIQGRRDEAVLVTKCGLVWDRSGGRLSSSRTARRSIATSAPVRARRAGGEPQAPPHRPCRRADHPLAGPDDAHRGDDGGAPRAQKEGKIRAIGISNASAPDLRAYLACGQVDCVQEAYSAIDRGLEAEILPLAREGCGH